MEVASLEDVDLEYDDVGSGEPLLLIHGGVIDTFFPEPRELGIADDYRVISYHRRGYGRSSGVSAPFSIEQQAGDADALLRFLGIARAHVAGHSYGGAIAIQLSLAAPGMVGSLLLLEPGLASCVPSGAEFYAGLSEIQSLYEEDPVRALATFFAAVLGSDYRELLDRQLSAGAFERALSDSDTAFQVELQAGQDWSFAIDDARCIRQPVLSVLGEDSLPIAHEVHSLLKRWVPHAEELVVPEANHALPYMKPHEVSAGLVEFLERHPL